VVEVLAVVLELCPPPCKHPVTVTLSLSAVVELVGVVVLGVCADARLAAQRNAAAKHAVCFILSPL